MTMQDFMWVTHYGAIPKGYEVNHIDCNKHNNRIDNLELVTHRQNCQRKKIHLAGKQCGYSYDIHWNKYKSQAYIDGKNRHLGYYPTMELAIKRYWQVMKVIQAQQVFDFA